MKELAYLSISFADAQLGRCSMPWEKALMRKIQSSYFGDHGWHLGKESLAQARSGKATRIPFMISVPGLTKGARAVTGRYPLRISDLDRLCGLKPRKVLMG